MGGLRKGQLAFDLPHPESFAREDFVRAGANAMALDAVERWPDWPSRVLALVGAAGVGKSHIAAIWAERSGACWLNGQQLLAERVPAAVSTGALVLEDAEAALADEPALFHLLNMVHEEDVYLLLTARTLPAGLRTALPDLHSRLRAIPVLRLQEPDDNLLRAVLFKLFTDRQVEADDALIGAVMSRIERSCASAKAAVRLIDAEALRLRRPVTRLLAAEVLGSDRGGVMSRSGENDADMSP